MISSLIVGLLLLAISFVECCIHYDDLKQTLKMLFKRSILGYPLYATFNIMVIAILELPSKLLSSIMEKIFHILTSVSLDGNLREIVLFSLGVFMVILIVYGIVFFIMDWLDYKFNLHLNIDVNNMFLGINILSMLMIGTLKSTSYLVAVFIMATILTSPFAYSRVYEIFSSKRKNTK